MDFIQTVASKLEIWVETLLKILQPGIKIISLETVMVFVKVEKLVNNSVIIILNVAFVDSSLCLAVN